MRASRGVLNYFKVSNADGVRITEDQLLWCKYQRLAPSQAQKPKLSLPKGFATNERLQGAAD